MENVLVVEDDENIRRLFARVLEGEGYNVQVAVDGDEAMDALENEPPDILVLDMNIPFVSGFEIIRYIRSNDAIKDIRVIIVSANSNVPSTHFKAV